MSTASTTIPYVVKVTRHFYGPSKKVSLLTDGCGVAKYESARAAREAIKVLDASIYYNASNEYSRPDYQLQRLDRLPAYLKSYL